MDADLKSNYPIYFQILVLLTEMLFRKKTKKLNIYVFLFKEKQDLSTFCLSQSIYLNVHTVSASRQIMALPLWDW